MSRTHDSQANQIQNYSFLEVFANDRTLDEQELAFIEKLALRDGVVDDEERAVLHNIFSRITEDRVSPAVWSEVQSFRQRFKID